MIILNRPSDAVSSPVFHALLPSLKTTNERRSGGNWRSEVAERRHGWSTDTIQNENSSVER